MQTPRDVLTPDALSMLQTIADTGSFAAAARKMGMVPSALTYPVRQIEDALDVLLFDRSSRQARMTAAGAALLTEGARLLSEIDAVANRVKRVATGWESRFTIAVDTIISKTTMMELCEAFYAMNPPTQIRLRGETLSGTLEAVTSGQADMGIGTVSDFNNVSGVQSKTLGTTHFIFVIAPHHPLAQAEEPLADALIQQHRAVAVADSVQRGSSQTYGIFSGQEVLTVASMHDKLDAQIRGLGVGHFPEGMAARYLESGRLVFKQTERTKRVVTLHYAWRQAKNQSPDRAMQWWLKQLDSATTRTVLLENHASH